MGIHEKAWSGLNLVVFGKTPLLPMQLEQSIAAAAPANELRIESFEEYGQAFDYCKSRRNVGLIFLLENTGNLPLGDTFKQLASHYEAKGWPCFGVLIHDGDKTLRGYQAIFQHPNLIAYLSKDELLDPSKRVQTMVNVWDKFVESFERIVIPVPLQSTLFALAEQSFPAGSAEFTSRISNIISSKLNLSWIEVVALRWTFIVNALRNVQSASLKANRTLVQICDLAPLSAMNGDLISAAKSDTTLCARVAAVVFELDRLRKAGSLCEGLQTLSTQVRPGVPALLKHLSLEKMKILSIAIECEKGIQTVRVG